MEFTEKETAKMLKQYKTLKKEELTMENNSEATPIEPNQHFLEWLLLSAKLFKLVNENPNINLYELIQQECLRFFIRYRDWYKGKKNVDLFSDKIRFDCVRFYTVYSSVEYPICSNKNTRDVISSMKIMFDTQDKKTQDDFFHNTSCGFVEIKKDCEEIYTTLFTDKYIYDYLYSAVPGCIDISYDIVENISNTLKSTTIVDPVLTQWKSQILKYIDLIPNKSMTSISQLSSRQAMIFGYALARVILPQGKVVRANLVKFISQLTGYSMSTLEDAGKYVNAKKYGFQEGKYEENIKILLDLIKTLNGGKDMKEAKGPEWNIFKKLLSKIESSD